jgi:hypothetical protein
MYSLITVKEAFAARQAGKPVVCRHVESELFEKLNSVSAETWFDPHYVFAIEIETIEVAGITFTKPLTADEVQHGDDIYVVQSCGEIHHYKYQVCHEALNQSVARGFAQRDQENAQLQAQAFCELFGRAFREAPVVEMSDETKQKRKRKSKPESEQISNTEVPEEATSNDVEEKTSAENTVQQPVKVVAEVVETDASVVTKNNDVETSSKLKADFMLQLTGASELTAIDEIAKQIESDTRLIDNHKGHLAEYIKARQKVVHIESAKVIEQTPNKNGVGQEVEEYWEYQEVLNDLVDRASKAQTPAEANALIKYTSSWTEEQRKPLIDAINARLVELNPPVADASLSVRISKAMDLTELDALEIDVSTCDELIQPKLMEMVNKRRAELDPFFNPLESAS